MLVNKLQSQLEKEYGKNIYKTDIKKVIAATVEEPFNNGSEAWEAVFNTRLYNKQSGVYCRLLEYIEGYKN